MAKFIKNSKGSQGVKRTTVNYTPSANDLNGHLKGIDDALGAGNDNFVRNLYINIDDLDNEPSVEKINEYIGLLPVESKTLLATDSKLNIVIYRLGGG